MLNASSPLARLLDAPMRPGRVQWIGIRPARRAELQPVAQVTLDPEHGLPGDHYGNGGTRARQVTLIGDLDLVAIGHALGMDAATPEQLRRNIVVSGINLHALQGRQFRLGSAILEATGLCHPCSRMEAILGTGGYNAVRGHGGITARVVSPGEVRLGDAVSRVDLSPS
jgi:MOSC domain-containing protein YiiM